MATTAVTGAMSYAERLAEADSLQLAAFSLTDAVRLGQAVTELALVDELPITIEVRHGTRVAYRAALAGSTADNDAWLARKAAVVMRYELPTLAVRVRYEERGLDFNEATGLPLSEFAAHGGGIPIVVAGVGMVGFLGVSGLPQVEDHDLGVRCIRAVLLDAR
ncbi:MAG: heme-degrading domain-containing protein [Actinomycetales bacterium]